MAMELMEIIEASRLLHRQLAAGGFSAQAAALRELLGARGSSTETLRSISFTLKITLERTPELTPDLKAHIEALNEEVMALQSERREPEG